MYCIVINGPHSQFAKKYKVGNTFKKIGEEAFDLDDVIQHLREQAVTTPEIKEVCLKNIPNILKFCVDVFNKTKSFTFKPECLSYDASGGSAITYITDLDSKDIEVHDAFSTAFIFAVFIHWYMVVKTGKGTSKQSIEAIEVANDTFGDLRYHFSDYSGGNSFDEIYAYTMDPYDGYNGMKFFTASAIAQVPVEVQNLHEKIHKILVERDYKGFEELINNYIS